MAKLRKKLFDANLREHDVATDNPLFEVEGEAIGAFPKASYAKALFTTKGTFYTNPLSKGVASSRSNIARRRTFRMQEMLGHSPDDDKEFTESGVVSLPSNREAPKVFAEALSKLHANDLMLKVIEDEI